MDWGLIDRSVVTSIVTVSGCPWFEAEGRYNGQDKGDLVQVVKYLVYPKLMSRMSWC